MKKVLLITSSYMPLPPINGGAVETLTENYLSYNEQCRSLRFVAYSYGTIRNIDGYEKELTEYRYIEKRKLLDFLFRAVRKLTRRKTPDYFIYKIKKDIKRRSEKFNCAVIENRPEYAPYIKRQVCKKVILHSHNDWFGSSPDRIYDACDKIIAVSDFMRRSNLNDKTKDKMVVVFNAIDEKKFQINEKKFSSSYRNKIKNKYHIPSHSKTILYTGKIRQEKGALELVEAFGRLCEKKKDVVLLMAGSIVGSKQFCQNIMRAIKLNDKIIQAGYIDYSELPDLYSIADIQVIPSQCEDQCPLTAFEGICAGVPQIVSRSGGIPEIVDGAGAIVVERGPLFVDHLCNNMMDLVSDEDRLKQLSKKQLAKADCYKNELFCKKMLDEIEMFCSEPGDVDG